MSLSARRSDLKNHLSHQVVKRHLNLVTTTDLANDTAIVGGVSADLDASLASIDLGARPSSEAVDPKAAVLGQTSFRG
jgi:hypothetical protein